ncbi:MAG TPA: deoxyribonuclease IV [Candidatus Paceibacterota bacterium]|nr:deoxyribonuclease IV [Candidatus Paceibacterota bacterium]
MKASSSRIGAHVSTAGGIVNAPGRAAELGCETFQCFTRSPQGGPAPELTDEVVARFRGEMERFGMDRFVIHSPYYINLASMSPRIRMASIRVLREELERGSRLGAAYVMTHPGSHAGQSYESAAKLVRGAIAKILEGYNGSCGFLLEIAAGAGNVLGDTFGEVADMMRDAGELPGFAGVCFDTCHAFASGYDFSEPEKLKAVLAEFDNTIGLQWLKLTHVNDSKTPLGGRKDRHEHLGKGHIGITGLEHILRSGPFRGIDWILETDDRGREEDVRILREIRKNA